MKRVITYGTFDLFHYGHKNLLQRAKDLGDYLIVGITSSRFDEERGKLNVIEPLIKRIENVQQSGFADEIIIEEYDGQKIEDIQRYNIDIFAIGSDWLGKFDYLREFCEVVYLERTRGISSSQLRSSGSMLVRMGIAGESHKISDFIQESKYVSGVNIEGVYNERANVSINLQRSYELAFAATHSEEFWDKIDAAYITGTLPNLLPLIKEGINRNKHILCESLTSLSQTELRELLPLIKSSRVSFLEDIETVFNTGIYHLVALVKSGTIGTVQNVDISLNHTSNMNDPQKHLMGTAYIIKRISSLLIKLLGKDYRNIMSYKFGDSPFETGALIYGNYITETGIGDFKISETGNIADKILISGTKGYISVFAPWYKMDGFELSINGETRKYFYKSEGTGLRYEILEFIRMIRNKQQESPRLSFEEILLNHSILKKFLCNID